MLVVDTPPRVPPDEAREAADPVEELPPESQLDRLLLLPRPLAVLPVLLRPDEPPPVEIREDPEEELPMNPRLDPPLL